MSDDLGPIDGLQSINSIADVAAVLGVSRSLVQRAIRAGDLTAYKLGGRIKIHHDDVRAWIIAGRTNAPPDPVRSEVDPVVQTRSAVRSHISQHGNGGPTPRPRPQR